MKLTVTDTGRGMTQDIKEFIFEPFFTTKSVGKGTGLGLSTVYGIVKNHGGHINVYSEYGKGTTFTLYFPSSEKKLLKTLKKAEVITGDATILVVDDEESVRNYTERLLKHLEYKVLLAKEIINEGAHGFIQKPFRMQELSKAIAEVLKE